MRNAVKATVDAYDGTVTLYEWDDQRPDPQGLGDGVPRHGASRSPRSPPDLLEHLRYPEDLFKVQRYQFAALPRDRPRRRSTRATTGGRSPRTRASARKLQPPYRLFVRGPGHRRDDELRADLGLRAVQEEQPGGVRLGRLRRDRRRRLRPDHGAPAARREHAGSRATSPTRCSPTPTVTAKPCCRCSQGGASRVTYGNLLTLPVDGGLMYVQPIYAHPAALRRQLPDPALRRWSRTATRSASASTLEEAITERPRRRDDDAARRHREPDHPTTVATTPATSRPRYATCSPGAQADLRGRRPRVRGRQRRPVGHPHRGGSRRRSTRPSSSSTSRTTDGGSGGEPSHGASPSAEERPRDRP